MESMSTLARRSRKHQRPSNWSKTKIITLIIGITTLLLAVIGGYYIYDTVVSNEKFTETAQQMIKDRAQKDGFHIEKQTADNQVETAILLPKNMDDFPFDNAEQEIQTLLANVQQDKKVRKDTLSIGTLATSQPTEALTKYQLVVETYHWNKRNKSFEKPKITTGQATYSNHQTNQPITAQELFENEANLFGVQQVIRNKILADAAKPNEIIDDVLNFPTIGFDAKVTYLTDSINIELPKNPLDIQSLMLPYGQISPYANRQLIDPAFIPDTKPLDPEKKYIALTFDDGPSPATTPKLLKILAENDVHATFYLLGQNVQKHPEVVKQTKDAGHQIASHSYNHPQLTTLTDEELHFQVKTTDKAIFEAIGQLPDDFRPPYGAIDTPRAHLVGKPIIQWNVDSNDWKQPDAKTVAQNVLSHTVPGSIILLHDIHETSVDAVPEIIQTLKKQGYEFVTINELLGLNQKPLHAYYGKDDERLI